MPPPPPSPSHNRMVAAGVNSLGVALLARAVERAQPNANLFLSPASISSALALALAGAPPASETAR